LSVIQSTGATITALKLEPRQEAMLADLSERLSRRLEDLCPELAGRLSLWLDRIAGGAGLVRYFTHPYAFPTVLLPWWLEESVRGEVDLEFQADLAYSSMCGYILIRLYDNVMDDGEKTAASLLPASAVLHSEFQSSYFRHFPYGDPFWSHFDREWARCSEAAVLDAALMDINQSDFQTITSRKLCAAGIPLHAVALRCGQTSVPAPWQALLERFYPWHQFHNDFFDWQRDQSGGAGTYFLCEGNRRRGEGSVLRWFLREGFSWGTSHLQDGLQEMRRTAAASGSSPLQRYLADREALLTQVVGGATPGVETLRQLLRDSSE